MLTRYSKWSLGNSETNPRRSTLRLYEPHTVLNASRRYLERRDVTLWRLYQTATTKRKPSLHRLHLPVACPAIPCYAVNHDEPHTVLNASRRCLERRDVTLWRLYQTATTKRKPSLHRLHLHVACPTIPYYAMNHDSMRCWIVETLRATSQNYHPKKWGCII